MCITVYLVREVCIFHGIHIITVDYSTVVFQMIFLFYVCVSGYTHISCGRYTYEFTGLYYWLVSVCCTRNGVKQRHGHHRPNSQLYAFCQFGINVDDLQSPFTIVKSFCCVAVLSINKKCGMHRINSTPRPIH